MSTCAGFDRLAAFYNDVTASVSANNRVVWNNNTLHLYNAYLLAITSRPIISYTQLLVANTALASIISDSGEK